MKKLTLIFVLIGIVCIVQAQNYIGAIATTDFATGLTILQADNATPVPDGWICQIMIPGVDGLIDPPNPDGTPGGDDFLVTGFPGNVYYEFLFNSTWTGITGQLYTPTPWDWPPAGQGAEPCANVGENFYWRIFDDPTVAGASQYLDTALYLLPGNHGDLFFNTIAHWDYGTQFNWQSFGGTAGTGSGTSTAGELVVIDVSPIDLPTTRVMVDPDVTFDPVSGPLQCDVVVAADPQGPHIDPPYPGNVLISYLTTFTGTTAQQIDMILSYSGFGVDLNWIGWWDGSAWIRPDNWVFNDGLEEVSFDITPATRDGVYEFVLGSDDPLPVTLTNFAAEFVSNNLTIFWTTQSESSNMGWNIYRGESNTALEDDNTIQINFDIIEGAGTTSEPTDYTFQDEHPVVENNTYWYWLESVSFSLDTGIYGPISLTIPEGAIIPELPSTTVLYGNFPNPFNPITTIQFDIQDGETADLIIYNIKGQIVLSETNKQPGAYNYEWDSKDNASGVYFYKLSSPSYSEFKKMMLLK